MYGCNPDTDEVQVELLFKARDTLPGGHICVRTASGERHEFRYSPPGNTGEAPSKVHGDISLTKNSHRAC